MMTPLHLSSADLVNLPIHRSRHRKPSGPSNFESFQRWCSKWLFQVVVPSVELKKLAYREESVTTAWM